MRKLFLSFNRLLIALHDKALSNEDLVNGLYCLGATYSYVMDPWSLKEGINDVDSVFGDDRQRGRDAHGKLAMMLVAALRDGRIVWRGDGDLYHVLGKVNAMFERNGLPAIQQPADMLVTADDIRELVRAADIPLEVC